MSGLDAGRDAHKQVNSKGGEQNTAKWSHELLGGAAAFEGMKLFEDKQRGEGKVVSHGFAKEILAGLTGMAIDRLIETKGMDEIDAIKARKHAQNSAREIYEQHYEEGQKAEEYDPNRYEAPKFDE